nr:MAG TPA: hypothetical protein [Caudoviricetes sp.]
MKSRKKKADPCGGTGWLRNCLLPSIRLHKYASATA